MDLTKPGKCPGYTCCIANAQLAQISDDVDKPSSYLLAVRDKSDDDVDMSISKFECKEQACKGGDCCSAGGCKPGHTAMSLTKPGKCPGYTCCIANAQLAQTHKFVKSDVDDVDKTATHLLAVRHKSDVDTSISKFDCVEQACKGDCCKPGGCKPGHTAMSLTKPGKCPGYTCCIANAQLSQISDVDESDDDVDK